MELNTENVEKVFKECLSAKGEGEGIVYVDAVSANVKFAFSKEKLDLYKTEISAWIDLLPEPFHESKGGGWSFMNMCATKDEKQWTGIHASVEQLLCLAIGIGRMKYLTERSMWSILPGGMPYVAIIDE